MKYMLLAYSNASSWDEQTVSAEEIQRICEFYEQFEKQALDEIAESPQISRGHRLAAVRGHLLELAGDHEAARAAYQRAARLTLSVPERRYLQAQGDRLATQHLAGVDGAKVQFRRAKGM